MKKVICCLLIICSAFLTLFFSEKTIEVSAKINNEINYLALGDSIADGYALEGYLGYNFIENAYTTRFKNKLETDYLDINVSSLTYAKEGDKTYNLLQKLDTFYSAVSNADIITICIGANDILGLALQNVSDFINGNLTVAEMEDILEGGINTFKINFPKVLNKIYKINPNAKVIFNNIYNPYKCFYLTGAWGLLASLAGIDINNVNKISEITEVYLAGGTNSQGENVSGLNNLLASFINESNCDNFFLADVKAVFDKYITDNGSDAYSDIVNVNANNITLQNFNNFSAYADPHPTAKGHKLIFETIYSMFNEKLALVNYIDNIATINGYNNICSFENKGSILEKPADQIKEGYIFLGWENSVTNKQWNFEMDVVTENLTLTAKWEKAIYYIVDFNLNGATGNISSQQVIENTKLTKPDDPSREYYKFLGWFTSVDGETEWNFETNIVTNNITLYAKWERTHYEITFNLNVGSGEVNSQQVKIGDLIVKPTDPVRENYRFLGWENSDTNKLWNFETDVVTENLTLTAKWEEIIYYIVDFNLNGAMGNISSQKVIENTKLTKPDDPSREGYKFLGWFTSFEGETEWDFTTNVVTNNITLYANWEKLKYQVNFNLNSGSGNVNTQQIEHGNLIEKPTDPLRENYRFLGWENSDTNKLWNFETDVVTENLTLTAKWEEIIYYIVDFNLNGAMGNISSQKVIENTKLTKPDDPSRECYIFLGWFTSYDGEKEWDFATNVVTNNITLYANWERTHYEVIFNLNGGSGEVNNQLIKKSNLVVEPEKPIKENCEFLGWYTSEIEGVKWDFDFYIILGDTNLYARWGIKKFTVNFVTNGGTSVASKRIPYNETFTEPTTFKTNYPFAGWYKESNFITPWNFETDILENNTTLYAKWIELTCNNDDNLIQHLNSPITLTFSLNIDTLSSFDISWYVNNNLQEEKSNSFVFTPNKSGNYIINSKVNNVFTTSKILQVNRTVYDNVEIIIESKEENNYIIKLEENNYSNNELKWYKSSKNGVELVAEGVAELEYSFSENCEVYIQHSETNQIISNKVKIQIFAEPIISFTTLIIIVVGSIIVLVSLVFVLKVIRKKKHR